MVLGRKYSAGAHLRSSDEKGRRWKPTRCNMFEIMRAMGRKGREVVLEREEREEGGREGASEGGMEGAAD